MPKGLTLLIIGSVIAMLLCTCTSSDQLPDAVIFDPEKMLGGNNAGKDDEDSESPEEPDCLGIFRARFTESFSAGDAEEFILCREHAGYTHETAAVGICGEKDGSALYTAEYLFPVIPDDHRDIRSDMKRTVKKQPGAPDIR